MSLYFAPASAIPVIPWREGDQHTQNEPVFKGTGGNKTSQGGDVSQLGKSLEGQEEDGEDVLVQETGSWKSKYFVILGFFLVFFLFLIVIGFLVWKLRRTKVTVLPTYQRKENVYKYH